MAGGCEMILGHSSVNGLCSVFWMAFHAVCALAILEKMIV